ncbi:AAA family ATPase [Paludibacter sp.]
MINYIQIKNFKSIRKVEMELKPINIFIGANGAGKSNFIGFFKLLKNIYEKSLNIYTAEEMGADNILHFGSKQSDHLSGRVEFNNTNGYEFKLLRDQGDRFFFEYEHSLFHKKEYLDWYIESFGEGYAESKLIDSMRPVAKHVRNYFESFKIFHFHDTSTTAKIKRTSNINDNWFLKEHGENLAAFLNFLQITNPNEFKRIEMVVRSVAPYFERFNLQPDRINSDIIRLEWKEKGSDQYFNAKHLSDGTLRFIALATLLLQPQKPQVIIIDEPELGLHPFAISKLAGLIKKASASSQIILSTQSVNLIDYFEPEDIITVDRKEGQSVFKRQNSEELKDWLENYTISDLWNKNVIGGRP